MEDHRVLAVLEGGASGVDRAALAAGALAQRIAGETGARADLVMVGPCLSAPGRWDRAWQCDAAEPCALAAVLSVIAGVAPYRAILAGDTPLGRETCARLAVRLDAPVVAPLLALRRRGESLQAVRPAKGGAATAILDVHRGPLIGVVHADALGAAAPEPARPFSPARLCLAAAPSPFELRGEERPGAWEMDVADADVVVAGGRGVGPEGFAALGRLAELLGGTVGASRVAVDSGWVPYARQVGLTGKTVSPRLYIACGISGAIHHTLGMRDSAFVVAINSDPNAPIFKLANAAIVGDARDIVPALIRELEARARPGSAAAPAGGAA